MTLYENRVTAFILKLRWGHIELGWALNPCITGDFTRIRTFGHEVQGRTAHIVHRGQKESDMTEWLTLSLSDMTDQTFCFKTKCAYSQATTYCGICIHDNFLLVKMSYFLFWWIHRFFRVKKETLKFITHLCNENSQVIYVTMVESLHCRVCFTISNHTHMQAFQCEDDTQRRSVSP